MEKVTDNRQFRRILRDNGYKVIRHSGGHTIYSNGKRTLSINAEKPNRMVMGRLIKEYNLAV